jgi:hypothetical protein
MINKKKIIFASTQVQKWLNLKKSNNTICILADEKLCEVNNDMLIIEPLTETINVRVISNYLRNLRNNPSRLKMQSRDQNLI